MRWVKIALVVAVLVVVSVLAVIFTLGGIPGTAPASSGTHVTIAPGTPAPNGGADTATPTPAPSASLGYGEPGDDDSGESGGCTTNPTAAVCAGQTTAPAPPADAVNAADRAEAFIRAYESFDSANRSAWVAATEGFTGGKELPSSVTARERSGQVGITAVTSIGTGKPLWFYFGHTDAAGDWVYDGSGQVLATYEQNGGTSRWVLDVTWTVTLDKSGSHDVLAVTSSAPTLAKSFPNG